MNFLPDQTERVVTSLFPTHFPFASQAKERNKRLLRGMKTNKAPGPDKIPAIWANKLYDEKPTWVLETLSHFSEKTI